MSDLISKEEVLNLIDIAFESGAFDGRYAYENLIDAVQNLIHTLETDLISRHAVLETLDDMDNALDEDRTVENYKELLTECYEVLPPVTPQPKKHTEERTKTHACDCINRQAAIDEIEWEEEYGRIDTGKAIDCLKKLPSVEPERNVGKWLKIVDEETGNSITWHYICSLCKSRKGWADYDYCPNCGAKMEV